ncbi:MAG TPA: FtsQ-type POTRA domain-containing protein [Anaerolineales bacterium]|nr:FtsQ-type POTRA domain-containing protein [Anaerolineales bacterium]
MSRKKELSHAELVRRRRDRENLRHLERAATEATRPVPPVTRRATRQEASKQNRRPARASGARRRFQIALHVPRREARSLSIPRPRLGGRVPSFLLVLVLGAALYGAFNLPQLRVTQAQITGAELLSPAEINSALNVVGRPIFLFTPENLETRLRLHYPELVSVQVEVALPNLVSVHITERRPVIRWEQGGGYTWISEDGVAFRPRGEVPGLIWVVALSGPNVEISGGDALTPAPFISVEMVQALKGLAAHVPPNTPILYDPSFGFGWSDPRGWNVHFGTSARDVALKVRVYDSMVNSLTQRGIQPVLINVMYPTAPYYRIGQQ